MKDDRELISRAMEGDEAAYRALLERYERPVFNICLRMLRSREEAEDLAQEAFIKAYGSLGKLEDPAKFGGWLRVICRNTCADYVRSRKSPVSLDVLRESGQEPVDRSSATPLEDVSGSETAGTIMREIAALREDYREIVLLRHIEDLSYKEIAKLLGMSISAVGEKLSRVRDILRRKLRRKVR